MAYNDEATLRKKKAAAILLLLQFREHDEQLTIAKPSWFISNASYSQYDVVLPSCGLRVLSAAIVCCSAAILYGSAAIVATHFEKCTHFEKKCQSALKLGQT